MIAMPHRTIPYSEEESISSSEYRVAPMKKGRKRQRPVSFNLAVVIQEVLHINNYTHEECKSAWYNRGDYIAMKRQCQVTMDLIERGAITEDFNDHCIVGLERIIQNRSTSRLQKSRVELGIDAVMKEQAGQGFSGISDVEAISVAYVDAINMEPAEPESKGDLKPPFVADVITKQRRITKPLSRMIRNRMRRRNDKMVKST